MATGSPSSPPPPPRAALPPSRDLRHQSAAPRRPVPFTSLWRLQPLPPDPRPLVRPPLRQRNASVIPLQAGPPPATSSQPSANAPIYPFPPTRAAQALPLGPRIQASRFARGRDQAPPGSDLQGSSRVRGSNLFHNGRCPTLRPHTPGTPPRGVRGFAPIQPPQGPGQSCPVRAIRLPMESPTTSPRPALPTHCLASLWSSLRPYLQGLSPAATRVSTASDPQGSPPPHSRRSSLPARHHSPQLVQP